MDYTKDFKALITLIAGKNAVLTEEEKNNISDAVDKLVEGLKKDIQEDNWNDSKGNLNV